MAGPTTVKDLISYLEENFDPDLRVKVGGKKLHLEDIRVEARGHLQLKGGQDESRNTHLD